MEVIRGCHAYTFVPVPAGWSAAEEYCKTKYFGHLVSIHNDSESLFVRKTVLPDFVDANVCFFLCVSSSPECVCVCVCVCVCFFLFEIIQQQSTIKTAQNHVLTQFPFYFFPHIFPNPQGVWIGLTRTSSADQYRWSDGTPRNYESWLLGEPKSLGNKNEECVALGANPNLFRNNWNNAVCTNRRPYGELF